MEFRPGWVFPIIEEYCKRKDSYLSWIAGHSQGLSQTIPHPLNKPTVLTQI